MNQFPQSLTKREYFAALAMQGFSSNPNFAQEKIKLQRLAELAVDQADALIAELKKPRKVV